jgi:hypothetical protein
MATQFYRTLDDIVKLKQENQQRLNDRVVEINETTNDSSYEDELAALKSNLKLVGATNSSDSIEDRWNDRSKRQEFIKEHNIKPGSPRWFRVMYARPDLTGEDPFGE